MGVTWGTGVAGAQRETSVGDRTVWVLAKEIVSLPCLFLSADRFTLDQVWMSNRFQLCFPFPFPSSHNPLSVYTVGGVLRGPISCSRFSLVYPMRRYPPPPPPPPPRFFYILCLFYTHNNNTFRDLPSCSGFALTYNRPC